jgi:FeS assembly SUF system protein
MAAKSFWQSMTGWIKPPDAPAQENASPASAPGTEPMAYQDAPPEQRPAESPQPVPSEPAAATMHPPSTGESGEQNPELKNKIIEVIKTCYDPEIPVNIYELGLIYDVRLDEENNAHVKMTLTAPSCPAAQSLPAQVRAKIEALEEIKSASVEIVFDPPWNPNKMSDSAKLVLNIL